MCNCKHSLRLRLKLVGQHQHQHQPRLCAPPAQHRCLATTTATAAGSFCCDSIRNVINHRHSNTATHKLHTHRYEHRYADTLTHSHPVLDYAKHLHIKHEAAARLVVDCILSGGTGELSNAYQSIRCLLSRLCYYCCSCRCTCRSISICICICAPETTLNIL